MCCFFYIKFDLSLYSARIRLRSKRAVAGAVALFSYLWFCVAFAYERGRLVLDGLFCVLALVLLDKPFFHILWTSLYHTARTFGHWAVLWHFISPVLRLSLWFLTAFRLILLAFYTFFGVWLAKLGRFERIWYLWCKLAWDSVHIFNRVFLLWGLYFALL